MDEVATCGRGVGSKLASHVVIIPIGSISKFDIRLCSAVMQYHVFQSLELIIVSQRLLVRL